jgi:hypothetical protein
MSQVGTKQPIKNVRREVCLQARGGYRLSVQLQPEMTLAV